MPFVLAAALSSAGAAEEEEEEKQRRLLPDDKSWGRRVNDDKESLEEVKRNIVPL